VYSFSPDFKSFDAIATKNYCFRLIKNIGLSSKINTKPKP